MDLDLSRARGQAPPDYNLNASSSEIKTIFQIGHYCRLLEQYAKYMHILCILYIVSTVEINCFLGECFAL